MPSRTANILMPVCAFKFTRYVAYLIHVHTSVLKSRSRLFWSCFENVVIQSVFSFCQMSANQIDRNICT